MTEIPDRLDGRERVLAAALALFGANGAAGTSVRAIAAQAAVSPANVLHHFGSKQALRAAVDRRVLDQVETVLIAAAHTVLADVAETPDPTAVLGSLDIRRYLRRTMLEADPAAASLVRDMVGIVRSQLEAAPTRPGADLDYGAVQVVALVIGPIALGPLLDGFEEQTFLPDAVRRRAQADLDLLRGGLLRPPNLP